MYNAQTIRERLKERQKIKGVKNSDEMMEELDLGVNIIRQMSDKKGVGCFALAKIADYLDCSVDYLLGRTDDPHGHSTVSIGGDNNNNGTQAINGNVSVTAHEKQPDSLTEQFLQQFDSLSFEDKLAIMQHVQDIKKSSPEGDGEE